MGTPAFMAPEQLLNSKDVDRRADVYALGVVLYQMLTGGALPWGNTEAVEIYRLQMLGHLPDPRTIVASISPSLVEVIHRAMAANREDRWADAKVFAQVLAEAIPAQGMTPSGPEILRTYAQELMPVGSGSTTIGNRISGSVPAAVANAPAVAWSGPSVSRVATPYERPVGSSSGVPRVAPTTLGGSAAQSVPNTFGSAPKSRRGLFIALGAVGVAVAATLAVVTMSGGGSASPSASTSARVDAGTVDVTTSAPVDAATISATPELAIDAAVPVDAPIDAPDSVPDASSKRDGRGGKPRGDKRDAGTPTSGSGSGSGKPFDPNSVGGDG
jgi:serine/threonine-protein kinase